MTLLDIIKSLLGVGDSRQSSDSRNRFEESRDRSEPAEPATDTEAAVKGVSEETDETDEPAAAGGDATGSTESMVDEHAEGGAEPGEVTGPESGSDVDSAETTGSDGERKNAAAAGGDAADSTGSMTEEDETDVAAEPGEAAGPESEDADLELDHSGAESSDESDADTTASEGVGVDETADDAAAAGADAAGSTGSMTEETNESISATEDAEAVGPTGEEPTGETDDHAVDVLKGIGPSYGEQLESAGVETIADLAAADAEELTAELDISESRIERWVERAKARRQ